MTASPDDGQALSMRILKLETALYAMGDCAIMTMDPDGTVRGWNHASQVMRGYTAEEVIGQPASMLATPEDREAGLVERVLLAARDTGRCEVEGWRPRQDGSRFWVSAVVVPVRDDDGTLTGFVSMTRDVTEQRRTESLFEGLLASAPDAMVIITGDGRMELVNRQAELLFGYSREDLVGREVEMLIPHRFRARHPAHRAGYDADPVPGPVGAGLELRGLRNDGTEFPVEISLAPLETPDHELLVAAAIREVTEQRETRLWLAHQPDEVRPTQAEEFWAEVVIVEIGGVPVFVPRPRGIC